MELYPVFSDNMILQREKPVAVFGMAKPQEQITVSLKQRQAAVTVTAEKNGYFIAYLPAQQCGEADTLTISSSDETISYDNILFGEVWYAGGQSNMEFELQNAQSGQEELALLQKKNDEEAAPIRFYYTEKMPYETEEWKEKIAASCWRDVREEQAKHLSAVAYYAAKQVRDQLQVPVGIINCNHGGTSISCWMSLSYLETFEDGRYYIKQYQELVGDKTNEEYLSEMEDYQKILDEYLTKVEDLKKAAQKDGKTLSGEQINELAGSYPWPEPQGWLSPYRPGGLFETMVKQVCPYTVRGIWFYQGEEDSRRYSRYQNMLTHFISYYRFLWKEELPFMILQLPMFLEKGQKEEGIFAGIRKAQKAVSETVAGVALVPLCDLGEYDNIHPVDKLTPGTRLGNMTLNRIYEKGPGQKSMQVKGFFSEGGSLAVYFDSGDEPLFLNTAPQGAEPSLKPLSEATKDGTSVSGFEIAGADGIFYPAEAIFERGFLLLYAKEVPAPIAMRYAARDYIVSNLYNKDHMPLEPYFG